MSFQPAADLASREWRSNSLWKFVDVGSANALRFILTIAFARRLSVDDFGAYATVVMAVAIMVTLSNLGLPTAVSRFLAEAREAKDAERSRLTLSSVLRIRLVTWLPTVVFIAAVGVGWGEKMLPGQPMAVTTLLLVGYALAQSASVLLEYMAAGLGLYRDLVFRASVVRDVVRGAGFVLFVLLPNPGVVVALCVEAAAWITMALAAAMAVARGSKQYSEGSISPARSVSADWRPIWSFALHAAPVTILSLGSDWIGPALALLTGGQDLLATYTVTWRCLALVLTLLPISGVALLPALARLSLSDRQTFVSRSFPRATYGVLWITTAVALATFGLLPVVFGPRYQAAAVLAIPLSMTLPVRVLAPALRQLLLLHGRGPFASAALGGGAVVSMITVLILHRLCDPLSALGWGLVVGAIVEIGIVTVIVKKDGYRSHNAVTTISYITLLALAYAAWYTAR